MPLYHSRLIITKSKQIRPKTIQKSQAFKLQWSLLLHCSLLFQVSITDFFHTLLCKPITRKRNDYNFRYKNLLLRAIYILTQIITYHFISNGILFILCYLYIMYFHFPPLYQYNNFLFFIAFSRLPASITSHF